ncbi:type II toxin-antitoxin system death-on-curing family toxin [Nocardioides sp. KR10-350]|uniref:type II toxin-antitoxin system death-on-curing family toxin n=1 Tax=Nocardioides cheoyonin TaxID=3156615 RepID=UPI0032B58C7D
MVLYLTAQDVLWMNGRLVGPDRLRDFGLLDAAVSRPQASAFGEDAFPDIHTKAAALLHGLARNHPFVDGNKRTAWVAMSVFYQMNGYTTSTIDQGEIVGLVVDVAEGQLDVNSVAGQLKAWVVGIPPGFDPYAD